MRPRHIIYVLSLFAPAPILAASAGGATAYISIYSDEAWSTARSCVAKCVWYTGVWHPSNAGYQDLAVHLGCGAGGNNGCYCNSQYATSATNYINSCITAGCGKAISSLQPEVNAMLSLYNGYCSTALAAPAATSAATSAYTSASTARSTPSAAPAAGSLNSQTTAKPTGRGAATGETASPSGAPASDEGLSKSDIIALASGLGIGIPSLLVAIIALWIQLKKRRGQQKPPTQFPPNFAPPPTTPGAPLDPQTQLMSAPMIYGQQPLGNYSQPQLGGYAPPPYGGQHYPGQGQPQSESVHLLHGHQNPQAAELGGWPHYSELDSTQSQHMGSQIGGQMHYVPKK